MEEKITNTMPVHATLRHFQQHQCGIQVDQTHPPLLSQGSVWTSVATLQTASKCQTLRQVSKNWGSFQLALLICANTSVLFMLAKPDTSEYAGQANQGLQQTFTVSGIWSTLSVAQISHNILTIPFTFTVQLNRTLMQRTKTYLGTDSRLHSFGLSI